MTATPQVSFKAGVTGSTLLQAAMTEAVGAFPGLDVALPSEAKAFKRALPTLIGDFEARRAHSPQRVAMATSLADHVSRRATFGQQPLTEAVRGGDPGAGVVEKGSARPGWTPVVSFFGRDWRGAELGELADRLREASLLTEAAAEALRWVAKELLDGPLDLTGHRFALLGAGAELAPTGLLLEAGAEVLWVDRQAPKRDPSTFAGTLLHHPVALDLLGQTPAVCAAVAAQCSNGPVNLGLYAYAPGKGRELTLTAAMNAIATEVQPASAAILVSPTTPGEVQPEDRVDRERRRRMSPRWQRALGRSRLLEEPSFHAFEDVEISRSIVGLQGSTYLAAQYLMKMMTAEAWAASHPAMRVSCNVAGITQTTSLEHPLFLAGFAAAPLFGVHIFTPAQTRVLNTLLWLHDVLNPAAPHAEPEPDRRVRRMASQAIHGGVRSAPFVLESTIRVAAVLGLARHPGLLLRLRR